MENKDAQGRIMAGYQTPDLSEGDSNLSVNRKSWQEKLDGKTKELLERDAGVFLHQSLSTPCINALKGCSGSSITDLSGRTYLDFHGNSVHQVGFSNQQVVEAVINQLKALSFCTRRYTNETAVRLAERLVELAPGDLGKVLFAPGGTTSVGMALKLARVATGRHKTLSMWDAFHGASLDAISIGGESIFRKNIGPLMPGTEHVPPPEPYRCLFNDSGECRSCGLKCARYIDYVLEKEGDIAAFIAEPIRCTAITPPPDGFWKQVKTSCEKHGALLIFDETAVCLGRTGRMFAFENYDTIPDMVIIGKGLGGGIIPFSALIAGKDLDLAPQTALGHYTHEKNPVASAAALAAIDYIENHQLLAHARKMGKAALLKLEKLKAAYEIIGDVRGEGLLFGLELVLDRKLKTPAVNEADRIMYRCLELGLSFKVSKGNFLTLTPPLTLSESDLNKALNIIEQAVSEINYRR